MKWCNLYNVWLDEVEEIIDFGIGQCCDFDCSECEYQEAIQFVKDMR